MNILFLDIDGVLNSNEYLTEEYEKVNRRLTREEFFDPKCMRILKKIVTDYKLKIVITSSWKIFDFKTVIDVFKNYELEVLDSTKNYGDKRGAEIREWLVNHDNISKFVIIDDDFFPDYVGLEGNLVMTSFYKNRGLNESHIPLVADIILEDKLTL